LTGASKYWIGGANSAGQGTNIGFDATTGARILGVDSITNQQQIALDMAAHLAALGITDINQLGVGDIKGEIPVNVRAQYDEDGNLTGYSKYDPETEQFTTLSAAEASKIKKLVDNEGNITYAVDGVIGQGIINKATGEAVTNENGGAFGSTYTGDKGTSYRLQIDPATGLPIFFSTVLETNDFKKLLTQLGPIGQIGIAIATSGMSIPAQIGTQFAIQVLSGNDIGDAIKSAFASYLGGEILTVSGIADITKQLMSIDSTGMLAKAFQGSVVGATKGFVTGQDVLDSAKTGFIQGGTGGAVDAVMANFSTQLSGLSKSQQTALKTFISGTLSGKPLDQTLIDSIISW
jgi:hypothetical protein